MYAHKCVIVHVRIPRVSLAKTAFPIFISAYTVGLCILAKVQKCDIHTIKDTNWVAIYRTIKLTHSSDIDGVVFR